MYVRYNRKRLKGDKGIDDTIIALSCLFNVLMDVCKVKIVDVMVCSVKGFCILARKYHDFLLNLKFMNI